jgi:hypothetical protein
LAEWLGQLYPKLS